jgi:hypothetical protein
MAGDNKVGEFVDTEQEEIEGQPTGQEAGEKKSGEAGGGMKLPAVLTNMSVLPYAGVLFSGMVLVIALTTGPQYVEDHKYYEYGVAVAAVAMIFAVIGWGLAHTNLGEGKFSIYNNYFLFAWGFFGACFMTFGGPFEFTGNGYFGAWGIVFFAIMGLGVSVENFKDALGGMGAMMGLLACSLIVIVAISSEGFDESKGELIYAIIVACITILVLAGLIMMEYGDGGEAHKVKLPILALFAILWIILACLLTFRGPLVFTVTGNGYFGSWGGAITSVCAAIAALKGGGEKGDDSEI